MAKYGNTWWGQNWLNALSNIDWQNRLPRGRSYASGGAVKKIEINRNTIRAAVQGRRRSPYQVEIVIPRFTNKEKKCLIEKITENTLILTQLLNRQLPVELYQMAEKEGIHLFPSEWSDFNMSCSCPDWAVPCKHLAAVIYMLANEIDKNPFLVFELHDFFILDELSRQNLNVGSRSREKILTLEDLTIEQTHPHVDFQYDEKVLETLDFSVIEDIRESLLELLSPKPLFYEKDFKVVLNSVYKNMTRAVSRYTSEKSTDFKKKVKSEKIYKIVIECDACFSLSGCQCYSNEDENHPVQTGDMDFLVDLLSHIELKELEDLYPPLIALTHIFHFSLTVLEKSAFIPQLLHLNDHTCRIRWIPAIINDKVNAVFQELLKMTPPGIIHFSYASGSTKKQNWRTQTPREQLLSLTALFIEHLMNTLPVFKGYDFKYGMDNILSLFFRNKPVSFDQFNEKEIPNTIQLWINKFYVTHKTYVPIIQVEDQNSRFFVDILVENKKEAITVPIPLGQFLSQEQYADVKFDVLKDITLLSEHFVQLKELIHTHGKERLVFDSVQFTDVLMKILPAIRLFGIQIWLPKALQDLVRPQASLRMQAKATEKINSYLDLQNMLTFEWQIALGDQLIDVNEFRKLVKNLSGVVKIKEQFVLIDQTEIERLFKNLNQPPKLSVNELLKSALTEEYGNARIQLDEKVQKLLESLIQVQKVDLPVNLNGVLRSYQIRGYEWMVKNARLGFGSLIADDMGLGKTLQVITALLKFKQEGCFESKKALIVVPTTLLTNWQKEIEKFTPDLKAFVYHGQNRKWDVQDCDCVITTYGIVRSETETLKKMKWHSLVIDEAQNIKNPGTGQTKSIKDLKAEVRIAMSGTPVENRLSEYWSILDYANKGYLGSLSKFADEFAKPIQLYRDHEKIERFHHITRPFILRRLKSDKSIIKDLPDKVENNQYCTLTKEQAALYQNVVGNTMKEIESSEGITRRGLVLKLMTALKQICNHPCHFLKRGKLEPELSGKSTLLFSLLENIYENHEKTLIFTQYREMGQLLVQLIENQFGISPLFLHGGTPRKMRDEMVQDFQERKHIKTFILSLKAGGTGLNLTAARNVIHYDLWWNPAVETQATDRAYRIGQTERVMVYRLLTKGTFEEKIDEMLKDKRELADLTVSTGEKWIGELSNRELKDLVSLSG